MNEPLDKLWHYESDGDRGARTHYAMRLNPEMPTGHERRDFPTAREAVKFIVRENKQMREGSR